MNATDNKRWATAYSSGGNNLSSDGNEPSSGGKSIEKVKKSKRVNPEIMKQAILELCQTPKTLQEISNELNREKDFIRRDYLSAMLSDGILELAFSDRPNHPDQAYRAKVKQKPEN